MTAELVGVVENGEVDRLRALVVQHRDKVEGKLEDTIKTIKT